MIKIQHTILLSIIPAQPIRNFALHREHTAQKAHYKKGAISDFCTENIRLTLITSTAQSGCLQGKKAPAVGWIAK